MNKVAEIRKNMLGIILGNICITLPYALLTIPHKIVNGGVTSTSLIISTWTHAPVAIVADILTILFLIIAFFGVGKDLFYRTLFSNICYMLFFHIFQLLPQNIHFNLILMAIISGIIVGAGYYFCLDCGASNGGFDIISLYLYQKNHKYDIAVTMRYISWFIILFGFFTFGIKSVILGLIFSFFQTETLKLLLHLDKKK